MDDEAGASAANGQQVGELHVVWSPFDDVAHVVSAATLAAADVAQNAPYLVDYGDLRRAGEIEQLRERLEQNYDVALEDYVSAIERSAGMTPAGRDLAARIAALADVEFEGGDDFPSDDEEFRPDWEMEEEPDEEFRGYHVISVSMRNDVPEDIFDEYCVDSYGDSPAFSGFIDSHVAAERLDAMILALQARGYTVVRE